MDDLHASVKTRCSNSEKTPSPACISILRTERAKYTKYRVNPASSASIAPPRFSLQPTRQNPGSRPFRSRRAKHQTPRWGKYALTFIDDVTQHATVFIIPNKNGSTVLSAFKNIAKLGRNGRVRAKSRSCERHRGTEYMGEMIEHIKDQGIEHGSTAGHSPQSNGVAERVNRMIFKRACTMLDASRAPLHLPQRPSPL